MRSRCLAPVAAMGWARNVTQKLRCGDGHKSSVVPVAGGDSVLVPMVVPMTGTSAFADTGYIPHYDASETHTLPREVIPGVYYFRGDSGSHADDAASPTPASRPWRNVTIHCCVLEASHAVPPYVYLSGCVVGHRGRDRTMTATGVVCPICGARLVAEPSLPTASAGGRVPQRAPASPRWHRRPTARAKYGPFGRPR
jgi:hypothetical protein